MVNSADITLTLAVALNLHDQGPSAAIGRHIAVDLKRIALPRWPQPIGAATHRLLCIDNGFAAGRRIRFNRAQTAGARIGAGVGIVVVSVIAILHALSNHAITAGCRLAIRQASIDIEIIAVVAGFISRLTYLQVAALDAVTAARRRAVITASVVIALVAVIACFDPLGDDSVTAAQGLAGVATRIVIHLVAVITSFISGLVVLQVLAPNPIAAARLEATTGTGVGLYPIAVVAVLTGIDASVTTDLARH